MLESKENAMSDSQEQEKTFLETPSLQFTLVDCPGHASLLKTVIGGAQIIDKLLLVVDATKGIQTQTAECLVLAEILLKPTNPSSTASPDLEDSRTANLIVVLNKVDLLKTEPQKVEHMRQIILKVLGRTSITGSVPIISTSTVGELTGLEELKLQLLKSVKIRELRSRLRVYSEQEENWLKELFYMGIDHCFPIKGKGTVLTGTVLSGKVSVGDLVDLPA